MALSKRVRFEIFKRDGFTCQYCGQRPPEVVLEVDHIHPQSKGGTDDMLNLITACSACNNGKRAELLSDRSPKPDADVEYLAIQQEVAELKRFLAAKEVREEVLAEVIASLMDTWDSQIGTYSCVSENQVRMWLTQSTPDEIVEAIAICAPKYHNYYMVDRSKAGAVRYVSGILKRLRGERDDG